VAVSPLWSIRGADIPSPVTSVARYPISGFARLTLKKSPLAYALKLEGASKGKQTYLLARGGVNLSTSTWSPLETPTFGLAAKRKVLWV
jgi:hypothetical protein